MGKILLFDWWGTLVDNGTYSPLRQTYKLLRPRMRFGQFVERFEDVFMTQRFESQEEAFHTVFDTFNIHPKSFVLDRLIGLWNKNRLLCKEYEDTAEALQELSKDYTLVLASNVECFIETAVDKFEWMDLFKHKFLSYETGVLKQNGAMVKHVMEELKVSPEDIIVIGDSIETDVAGAEAAGVKVILVDRKGKREFSPKVQSLLELGEVLDE